MSFINNHDIINNTLFIACKNPSDSHLVDHRWAICVHATIIEHWIKKLHDMHIKTECEIFKHKLRIGSKRYDMRLIILTPGTDENLNLLSGTIRNSQFSFPWETNPTLFIDKGSFNILEHFIKNHNLQGFILKIEEKRGISSTAEVIKVVTFNKSVDALNIIEKYRDSGFSQKAQYYYMTFAFPWLQPFWLNQIPRNIDVYSAFPIILRTINKTELNIMDLLSLRLALCDLRNPAHVSGPLKYEIDFLIKRQLLGIVKNNLLDLDEYLIDKKYEQLELLILYLSYEFQFSFKYVSIERNTIYSLVIASNKVNSIIKLAHATDVRRTIKERSNIKFDIDGSGYDRMSLSLFLDLIESQNVNRIILDTNSAWLNDECELNRSISTANGKMDVRLIGTNNKNFVEQFVSSLKTITFSTGQITLRLYCNLSDYTIFDNLAVYQVEFKSIKIDSQMLSQLVKCQTIIKFVCCTFENTSGTWALLNNLEKLEEVEILEDHLGLVWQSLYEFISGEVIKSKSKQFKFYHKLTIVISDKLGVTLDPTFKFTVDEPSTKLEIRNESSNEIIDLYDLKFELGPDVKPDLPFYQ